MKLTVIRKHPVQCWITLFWGVMKDLLCQLVYTSLLAIKLCRIKVVVSKNLNFICLQKGLWQDHSQSSNDKAIACFRSSSSSFTSSFSSERAMAWLNSSSTSSSSLPTRHVFDSFKFSSASPRFNVFVLCQRLIISKIEDCKAPESRMKWSPSFPTSTLIMPSRLNSGWTEENFPRSVR